MRKRSSDSGAGAFCLLFLLLLIHYLGQPLNPGRRVGVVCPAEKVGIRSGELSPFYRLTLGMPISVNGSTAVGLAAVPGIGPKTAAAIVRAREQAGGFSALKDLMSIRGIGPSLYQKISPYLTL